MRPSPGEPQHGRPPELGRIGRFGPLDSSTVEGTRTIEVLAREAGVTFDRAGTASGRATQTRDEHDDIPLAEQPDEAAILHHDQ